MKTLILLPLILLAGCCVTTFEVTKPDGTKVAVHNYRTIWTTDSYNAVIGTNSASLSATKSSVDAATAGAIAKGVTEGLVAGAPK